MVVENVRGAQPWVGRARWNYGSYYLWGDVPALMPMTKAIKNNGGSWFAVSHNNVPHSRGDHVKQGGSWFHDSSPGTLRSFSGSSGRKVPGIKLSEKGFNVAAAERIGDIDTSGYARTEADKRSHIGLKRRAASAMIAKIPEALARHIARTYLPMPTSQREADGK